MSCTSLHLIAYGASASVGGRFDPDVRLDAGESCYRLLFCQSGQVILRFADRKAYIAKKGDVILFAPNEPIEYRLGSQHNVVWVCIAGSEAAAWLTPVFDASPVCSLGALPAPLRHCLDALAQERYLGLLQNEAAVSAHLTLLLTYLQRAAKRLPPTPPAEFAKLLPALTAMEREYALGRAVADYAKLCRLSEYYFIRFFHKYMGMSPVAYRTKLRTEHACLRLETTDQSIAEIAKAVGYTDAAQFCKQFKAQTGQTPRAYRKETQP
jgi:AraC-like DNA-binding protein